MTVANKLRGAFALYILLMAALLVQYVRGAKSAATRAEVLSSLSARLRVTSTDQLERVDRMSRDVEKYLVTNDSAYLEDLLSSARDYGAGLRRLDSLPLAAPERDAITRLSLTWGGLDAAASRLAPRGSAGSVAPALVTPLRGGIDSLRSGTESLASASQEAMARELVLSQQAAGSAERLTWIVAAVALLLTLVLSAALARAIVTPLNALARGTREVSAGRFDYRLQPQGDDEFAQVSRDFNAMTERLHELDQVKRDFVSKVSHDLKTPLSSMQEATSALLDEVPGPLVPKQRQLLELTQESGRRLYAMLSKLLDLSRIEAGLGTEFGPLDLSQLVGSVVERRAAARNERDVRVALGESAPRLRVRGDADELARVLDNLIENAIKFSPANGTVTVRVAESDGQRKPAVLVTVSDEGPGVPEADKRRIFERFYQSEAGRAVRSRGIGLGLTICKDIVQAHGGEIWVSDNAPKGSVFSVRLPRVAAAAAIASMVVGAACAHISPFERDIRAGQWELASSDFQADSALMNNEQALYEAGTLYAAPDRPTYDPERARTLLTQFVARFPASEHRADAASQAALLDTVSSARRRAVQLQSRLDSLSAELQLLRVQVDSVAGLRQDVNRLEQDVRDRDAQIKAVRLELERLKEIDLKRKPPETLDH